MENEKRDRSAIPFTLVRARTHLPVVHVNPSKRLLVSNIARLETERERQSVRVRIVDRIGKAILSISGYRIYTQQGVSLLVNWAVKKRRFFSFVVPRKPNDGQLLTVRVSNKVCKGMSRERALTPEGRRRRRRSKWNNKKRVYYRRRSREEETGRSTWEETKREKINLGN